MRIGLMIEDAFTRGSACRKANCEAAAPAVLRALSTQSLYHPPIPNLYGCRPAGSSPRVYYRHVRPSVSRLVSYRSQAWSPSHPSNYSPPIDRSKMPISLYSSCQTKSYLPVPFCVTWVTT